MKGTKNIDVVYMALIELIRIQYTQYSTCWGYKDKSNMESDSHMIAIGWF